jgi:EmrB/QacA subfamily drug resistance transporter
VRAAAGRPAAVIAFAGAAGAFVSLDTMVNIALPAISSSFGIEVDQVQWVVISYVLVYASLLLLTGRLADLLGHTRVLTAGLVCSALAMVACGSARSFGWFLSARALQGVGAALVLGAAPALVTLSASDADRARALGVFQMAAAVGLAIGPPIGGLLVNAWGWRAVFLSRLPASLVVLTAVALLRPARAADADRPAKRAFRWADLDLPGAATLGLGVASLLLAVSRARDDGWSSPVVISGGSFGVLLLVLWAAIELRASTPVLDVRLFRRRPFSLANALNVGANGAQFAIWLLVPYYLVTVIGYSTVTGGLVLGVTPAASAIGAVAAGRLERRVGAAVLVTTGLFAEAAGLAAISRLGTESPTAAIVASLGLAGLGLGLFQVPNISSVMGTLPRHAQGVAGGLTQMMRTIGVISGVTAASLLFASRREQRAAAMGVRVDDVSSFVPAFRDVLAIMAVVCAAAALLSLSGRAAQGVRVGERRLGGAVSGR